MGKSILFVCTGNVYRSQIAEYIFRRMFRNARVHSAGLDDLHVGRTVGQVWKKTKLESVGTDLKALGINITRNKCKLVTRKDMERAENVFVMEESQKKALAKRFPEFAGKVRVLGKVARLKNPEIMDITLEPDVGKTVAKIRKSLEIMKKRKLLER